MKCQNCQKEATKQYKINLYFGTRSYKTDKKGNFCTAECYQEWWDDLTWHLDTLDERMNANIHFNRTEGLKGTYKGKEVSASWNGLETRHMIGEYEFKNRKPHPVNCSCSMV